MGAVIHLWKKQDMQEASVCSVAAFSVFVFPTLWLQSKAHIYFDSLVLRVIWGGTNRGKAVKHHSTLALHGNIIFQIQWAALL